MNGATWSRQGDAAGYGQPGLGEYDGAAVRAAILREGLSMVAHALLWPFGGLAPGAPPLRRRELRTVVFVHGLGANRSSFLGLRAYLRACGYDRQIAFNYRSSGSIDSLALRLKRSLDAEVRGGRIDIVAHSMGGLVARAYLQRLGGERRVDRLITLGTPHCGTHAANFVPSALVRQLLPESRFVRELNALPAPATRTTSIVAGRDLLVQPVEAARCPFGEAVLFRDLGHVELLFRPEVYYAVAGLLADPHERSEARTSADQSTAVGNRGARC